MTRTQITIPRQSYLPLGTDMASEQTASPDLASPTVVHLQSQQQKPLSSCMALLQEDDALVAQAELAALRLHVQDGTSQITAADADHRFSTMDASSSERPALLQARTREYLRLKAELAKAASPSRTRFLPAGLYRRALVRLQFLGKSLVQRVRTYRRNPWA